MLLEKPGNLPGDRVAAQIGGNVGQPDLVMAVAFLRRQGRRRSRNVMPDEISRREQLGCRRIRVTEHGERLDHFAAAGQMRFDILGDLPGPPPIAGVKRGVGDAAEGVGVVRLERGDTLVGFHRFIRALQRKQHVGTKVLRLDIIGFEC